MNYIQIRSMQKTAWEPKQLVPGSEPWKNFEKAVDEGVNTVNAINQLAPWYFYFNGGRGIRAMGGLLSEAQRAVKKQDQAAAQQSGSKILDFQKDFDEERALTKSDDWAEILKNKLPSYAGFTAGGALLGRLIAGKKNRLAGYLLGGLAGAAANYARRKSYYGDAINW